MKVIESYFVLLYDRTWIESSVDSARKHIFAAKARSIDAIPPIQATCCNTRSEPYFTVDMCGHMHIYVPQRFRPQNQWVGEGHQSKDGNRCSILFCRASYVLLAERVQGSLQVREGRFEMHTPLSLQWQL